MVLFAALLIKTDVSADENYNPEVRHTPRDGFHHHRWRRVPLLLLRVRVRRRRVLLLRRRRQHVARR